MQFDRHDMAVIEQALREAINQGADYHKVSTYQTVLGKLQGMPLSDTTASPSYAAMEDGFRYDYDDNAGL